MPTPVLVVVPDSVLSERVRRVAAASGRVSTHVSAVPARSAWDGADTVVVSPPEATLAARQGFSHGSRVIVVSDGVAGVDAWQAAATLGTPHVLELPAQESDLMRILAAETRPEGGDGTVVAVVGGCGGAGASVFATALAMVASRRTPTLLLDGDAAGGGLDLVAGLDDAPGLRWPDLVIDGGSVTADAVFRAVPSRGDLAVLSTRRDGGVDIGGPAWRAVVDAGRSAGGLVVCDVPRVGEVHDMAVAAADLVVLVVPATVRSAAAARVGASSIRAASANVGLVVRGPAPSGLTATEIADLVGAPLLAAVRPERRLAAMLDGRGLVLGRRSPLASAARDVLALLGTGA